MSRRGEWLCGYCQHWNFRSKEACHQCGNPMFSGGSDMSCGTDVLPGDWYCPACAAHNFASRTNCYKCQTPNLMGPGGIAYGSVPPGWKTGDWICNRAGCGCHNYACRIECYKCKSPRE
ncbi:hypothetical protein AAG906_009353 [Vitis piasezkii]|uniref:RanBP2-type domain-containing protein n=3 Tax=Vitis vinifera TaxID=29760 RepID=A0A438EIJ6_VITVI